MYSRFFAFISLFAFAMFALVVTDNLLVLYAAWEIMGLCSYLLIGFWYARPSARDAAVKAFLTTRVGDMFMLLGMVILYTLTGSLNYREILADPGVLGSLAANPSPILGLSWAALIGLLIFAGTVGKSAQFPLHTWLPDAMEGPTPVSAMIHAATMVSAGVFLSARFFPLISAGWEAGQPLTTPMLVMAAIGSFTALFAALIALGQRDIKRVLAYSTISQLGYMVAALGIGAYGAAVFHLFTHAFFKALLFLGSGSVIHGMEHGKLATGDTADPQDMFSMGGLRGKMPVTFWTFLAGALALSGFPLLTAGFWSKDEILSGAFHGNSSDRVHHPGDLSPGDGFLQHAPGHPDLPGQPAHALGQTCARIPAGHDRSTGRAGGLRDRRRLVRRAGFLPGAGWPPAQFHRRVPGWS